ncbi:hypothetical protein EfmAA610_01550 [Enterococcus faecium]|nr:hypothetical protein EfmAA610_01550 [Enterococcus faecium]
MFSKVVKFFCENYFYIIYMSKIYIIKEMLFDQLLFGISSKQNNVSDKIKALNHLRRNHRDKVEIRSIY